MTEEEIQKNSEHWYNKYKDLKTENNKLLDVINNQDVKIADLESENKKLEKSLVFARAEFQRQYNENAELKENYRKRGDIITSLERQLRLNIHSDHSPK